MPGGPYNVDEGLWLSSGHQKNIFVDCVAVGRRPTMGYIDWLKYIEKAKAAGALLLKIYGLVLVGDWLGVWTYTKAFLAFLGVSL